MASPALYQIFASDSTKVNAVGANLVTGGSYTSEELNTEVTISVTNNISFGTKTVAGDEYKKQLPLGTSDVNSVISWCEVINTGFTLSDEMMTKDLVPNPSSGSTAP
jgi:hypothetical protein